MSRIDELLGKAILTLDELEELTNMCEVESTDLFATKYYKLLNITCDYYNIVFKDGWKCKVCVKYD